MKKTVKKWTDADFAKLRKEAGIKTATVLAKEMGRSEGALRSQAKKHGIKFSAPGKKHSNAKAEVEDAEMVRVLHDHGYGARKIQRMAQNISSMAYGSVEQIVSHKTYNHPVIPCL